MANLAYFEIPADDIRRATKFYATVLGWTIEPTKTPGMTMEYYDVTTGEPEEGTLNSGGMYKRMEPDTKIITYAMVDNVDAILKKVEKGGGKIHVPAMDIPNVGRIAVFIDSEGNPIGIWKPGMPSR
jgi:predicted enzyme related to lactoylglutathione lyase